MKSKHRKASLSTPEHGGAITLRTNSSNGSGGRILPKPSSEKASINAPDFVGFDEPFGDDPKAIRATMGFFVPLAVNALIYCMYNADYWSDRTEAAKVLIEHAIGKPPQSGIEKEVQSLAWERLIESVVDSGSEKTKPSERIVVRKTITKGGGEDAGE